MLKTSSPDVVQTHQSHWLDPVISPPARSHDLNDCKLSFGTSQPQVRADILQHISPQPFLLLLFSVCAPAAAGPLKGTCAYSISGAYSPISRYLYYAFLIIPIIFHKAEWLVGGTLGASMLFSSIAVVHSIALVAVGGRETVDLDIIPVYSITGVGLLAGTPMMIWSKTLRQAAPSARAIVFSWIGLMFIGVLASVASIKAVRKPQPCDPAPLLQGSCGLICNTTLPMRNSQSVISIPYLWKDELSQYSNWFAAYATTFASVGLMYASSRRTPREMSVEQLDQKDMFRRLREKNARKIYCCALFIPPLGMALAFSHVVITELVMMGPHHLPYGEGLDAIGQWGTLVGAFFAVLVSVIKVCINKRNAHRELGANKDGTSYLMADDVSHTSHDDFGQVFKEGAWWGHKLNGARIPNEGAIWIVQDGKLQRVDESSN